ncbi:MAG: ferrochelatase [Alphaproteobacteria bacterium]|jgi:ferrochelatase|nr:ferrochelatase [Alphaproteobacteria bacterium]
MSRVAVVLFNLGGPDRPEAIRPFLFNLFNDPAILRLPTVPRWFLAQWISRRRAKVAAGIYAELGGKSPLLEGTEAQASALEAALGELGTVKVFTAMRYWHPMSPAVAAEVAGWQPDRVVLLPLYPQFSTTTTASSLREWHRAAAVAGLDAPSRAICCYPTQAAFVEAQARSIGPLLEKATAAGAPVRLLFSAHGLPERVVAAGDPYQWQMERCAAAVAARLDGDWPGLDWRLAYQSRVGRLVWIGPSTEDEIDAAGRDGRALVVVPIAFVSEHSETLVELDIEYRERAEQTGVRGYYRVPALGTDRGFIEGLAALVRAALAGAADDIGSESGERMCPATFSGCPMQPGAVE